VLDKLKLFVIARIQKLRLIEIVVRAGRASSRYQAVKTGGPDDLVFRSPANGTPVRDNNIPARHIEPATRKLGIGWVNWQVLRRSSATWMDQAKLTVKNAQGLVRHSRASTTQDVYQQDDLGCFRPLLWTSCGGYVVSILNGVQKRLQGVHHR